MTSALAFSSAVSPALSPVGGPPLAGFAARIDRALDAALERATAAPSPSKLSHALRYAVFPGGSRHRPMLCLAVAHAHGDPSPHLSDKAAVALEFVHCASLVHDDLPCFDDAKLRRGRPTVHRVFGESTAVLVGDALIVHAFESIADAQLLDAIRLLSKGTGASRGIIAGQAWENEPSAPLDEYHRAKTASLFGSAAAMGAIAAGRGDESNAWLAFGEIVGMAYQAADDLIDVRESSQSGKSGGRDEELNRPSVVRALGVESARRRVRSLLRHAASALPSAKNNSLVHEWLAAFSAHIESI